MLSLVHFLKGAQRIVLHDLDELLAEGEQPSIKVLADRTMYTERTVQRALQSLRAANIVSMEQPRRGARAEYQIHEEEYWFT